MITIPTHIKGLIFDLDGTIANTMPNHFKAWRKAVAPYGIDFKKDLFLSLTGMSKKATILKLNELFGTSMKAEKVGPLKEAYFNELAHEISEIEVVTSVIKLYHKKLPMTVGTGSSTEGAKRTLSLINMYHFFDGVITSDDVKFGKPNPETFLKCAEIMKVNPADCLVFEDGELGIQAAKQIGMRVIDINKYFKAEFEI